MAGGQFTVVAHCACGTDYPHIVMGEGTENGLVLVDVNFSKVNPDRSAPAHYYYLLLINIDLILLPTLTCAKPPDHTVQ